MNQPHLYTTPDKQCNNRQKRLVASFNSRSEAVALIAMATT